MQLNSISIKGLYGALSLESRFNEDITLLVGINGSGKTSVLNVIDWLLRPDLKRLAAASYHSLSLSFGHKGRLYVLTAKKTDVLMSLSLEGAVAALKPITVVLEKGVDPDDEDSLHVYDGLAPEKHEKPLWDLLKSFPKPTTISLDRSIAAELDDVEYVETIRGAVRRKSRPQSPLSYVQEITSQKYSEFRSQAIANDAELKTEIVVSALQDPDFDFQTGSTPKPMNDFEISLLEQKVVTYLTGTVKSNNIERQIRSFFASSRSLTTNRHPPRQHDLLLDFVTVRYRQIERLAKAFNDFEVKNAAAFGRLAEYLSAVNRFLKDSNKELYFDPGSGRLVFSFTNGTGWRRDKRSISHLSSGERQVLTLFTFLAFSSQSEGVFIVDEPELSLHPKWQHEFMDAFLRLRPSSMQLILATHSPDIVGKYKNSCVLLRGGVA